MPRKKIDQLRNIKILTGESMKRRKGYLVIAITCFVVATPLLLLMTGCGRVYLEPVEQVPIDQMFPAAPPMILQLDQPDSSSWSTANKIWITAAIGGQAADAATTIHSLGGGGCQEINPLLGKTPSDEAVVGLKIVAMGIGLWATEYWLDGHPEQKKMRNWIYGTLAVAGIGAAVWNGRQDCP